MAEKRINPFPPTLKDEIFNDTSRYVVPLAAFQRPRLYIVDGEEFVWPMGTEDISIDGAATLAEHKYIDDNALVVETTHLDASRISLSGTFPGKTGVVNMRALRRMMRLPNPVEFKRLEVPGILNQAQRVVCDNYSFKRVDGDAFGWNYTVVFVIVGTNPLPNNPPTSQELPNQNSPASLGAKDFGTPSHFITVQETRQTLKTLAYATYGNPEHWRTLFQLNRKELEEAFGGSMISATTRVLPLGLKLRYIKG